MIKDLMKQLVTWWRLGSVTLYVIHHNKWKRIFIYYHCYPVV